MSEQEGRLGYQDFYAVCNHMPGAERVLRVGGTVVAPTRGWTAVLEQDDGLPPVVQFLLKLKLRVTEPQDGAAEVITPIELPEYRIEDPAIEYEQVEFVFEGPDGIEGPPVIEVEHPR
ncbi:MAG TPA: hypothetical protein VFN92_05175 [Solirubrobacterales bacterium]|nr:hypothetical protein [Solirubrobacterales bacterium]